MVNTCELDEQIMLSAGCDTSAALASSRVPGNLQSTFETSL